LESAAASVKLCDVSTRRLAQIVGRVRLLADCVEALLTRKPSAYYHVCVETLDRDDSRRVEEHARRDFLVDGRASRWSASLGELPGPESVRCPGSLGGEQGGISSVMARGVWRPQAEARHAARVVLTRADKSGR
jgi:hypothetical protein